ncbi:MAG TPA: nicotinamide riboside transporter PnuC [Tenuifilaceae bacterium]|nr:nicotinamide riboside transporter PnuC [Tenuifilaceae bacterium]HNY08801.1 nicotinamide riboside transporter PnuC [Tenuifilaceae bacterium]HPS03732.1 nicotinamide riboside transporter PnuC [Tenuifilaceae bacterium]HPW26333.1 nicotinamide riboside transporter PnuC [Tenuifilaceae bacterium]HQN83034.1 nicotinamide riboside transporter PnuC [Tenuifilaceae bacterium]
MSWLISNYIELLGATIGLIYLYFEIKQKIWLWPLGIATSALYIYIYFSSKFYADMGLQVYYLIISIYGWYHWLHGNVDNTSSSKPLPVTRITLRLLVVLTTISLLLFVILWFVLDRYTDSPVPVGDAFTTALSITATWMLTRKIIEHWWVWIVVDGVSMGLYIYKGLYPTTVLFAFYTILSVVGYYQWKREITPSQVKTTAGSSAKE